MDIDPIVRQQLLDEVVTAPTKSELLKRKMKVYSWEWTLIFSLFLKRVIDIAGSLTAILILSPVFIITALTIYLHDKGPVLFVQKRVGKNGRLFDMYKFRSMVVNADKIKDEILDSNESSDGVIFKMKKDPRVTPIGRFIRKFSIDELPQLFNVLKGDMSLVGPRPPLPAEVAQYTLEQRKRLHVRPGITCVWQVSGRSDIPFTQQVQLDLDYIKSQSFITDVKLLLKTIPAVLLGKGGY
ncbi:sugar transferase [Sedimentisphaera salicampi]|uniref:Putative sugar transferase EpsL n=1 Tax=Sedimentisphaera salicampi TaxID=1941349 RepID=A0A1W6LJA8_9BACT|nr:sugar transferase [Sedimentisphaera salicampi]ARN55849.1 putative sugar transferase EpsL [Sedimentisphaera salicampi]OXU16040.1 putative sugar transferase EpsL [Sedimentisphaera salicampi]